MNVPETEDGYQPPLLPTKLKDEMSDSSADDRAHLVSVDRRTSYNSLVSQLLIPDSSAIEKVRTLYCWLGCQDIDGMDYAGVRDSNSPMGYMKLIKFNKGSYACLFTLLCRAAHIPSVIIHGIVKGIGYEPGSEDVSNLHSSWNAVYVEGSWRFVHTSCAFRTILGYSSGYWTPIESHANLSLTLEPRIKWSLQKRWEDFFLFPDPSDFIYLCFPDSEDWQLLKQPWTLEKFLDAPHLREAFFTLNFMADGIQSRNIQSKSEVASLTIRCKDKVCPKLFGTLYFDNMSSPNNIPEIPTGYKFIEVFPKDFSILIKIDIPIFGMFKLEIYGGKDTTTLQPVAEFRIKKIQNDTNSYNIEGMKNVSSVAKKNNGSGGFTYTFNKLPLDPYIGCNTKRSARGGDRGSLGTSTEDRRPLTTPHRVTSTEKTSPVDRTPLVTRNRTMRRTKTSLEDDKNPSHVMQENAKLERLNAKIKDLDVTVRKCETAGLKDCADLTEARTLLVEWRKEVDTLKDQQRLKHNLKTQTTHNGKEEAVNHQISKHYDNTSVTRVTSISLTTYNTDELHVLNELREKLAKYKQKGEYSNTFESSRYGDLKHDTDSKRVSAKAVRVIKYPLVKILKHIHRVNNPVFKTIQLMKALLLLLGYKEKGLQGWMYIQTILRNTDVLKQMENLKISDILPDTVVKVKSIMDSITREDIFKTNRELPELYDWVKWVLEEVDKR